MLKELTLKICFAVRQGRQKEAAEAFAFLLQQEQGAEMLAAAEDCLLAALRRQQYDLAVSWLQQAQPVLLLLIERAELAERAAEFLQKLAFAACDRRQQRLQPVLAFLLRRWLQVNLTNRQLTEAFWHEWLNLAARMARRMWRDETKFLLQQAGRALLKSQDMRLWNAHLQQLQLHLAVHARWDGFGRACIAYRELTELHLLLLRRVQRMQSDEEQAQWLQLLLRHMRAIVANASRVTMQEDMEIFRQWYSFFWQLADADVIRRKQLQQLLQLAIVYWQQTRPKTSRKQADYLQDLLQPSYIDEHFAVLLQKL